MKAILSTVSVAVCIYFVFFMNAILVHFRDIPEEIANHFLGEQGITAMIYAIFAVVPFHLFVVIYTVRKKHITWTTALPFIFGPYMLGVSIQTAVL
jgi:hypothetical protein